MKRTGLAVAAAMIAASGVQAQSFDGAYLGGDLGYVRGDADFRLTFEDIDSSSSSTVSYDGFELGLYGGYRTQFPNSFVIGGEVGGLHSWADGTRNRVFRSLLDDFDVTADLKVDKKWEFYGSLKPGWVVQPDTMIYLIGGVQRARFKSRLTLSDEFGSETGSESANLNGWHLGLGAEFAAMRNVSVRVEYKYQDYHRKTWRDEFGDSLRLDPSENVFRLGALWRF